MSYNNRDATKQLFSKERTKMANKSFRPVQFNKKAQPRIRFSFRFIVFIWIIILLGFFVTYMLLSYFSDVFIATGSKNNQISIVDETESTSEAGISGINGVINPVPKSDDIQGDSYFSRCIFVGDSDLDILKKTDIQNDDIKTGQTFTLTNIVNSGFSSDKDNIYLMLGKAELKTTPKDRIISSYTEFINSLGATSPNSKIYVMALPPVPGDSTDITNAVIDEYNSALLSMCNQNGINYLDTNTLLKDNSGALDENYIDTQKSTETVTLTKQAGLDIYDYILSHTVSS